jgi:hypothetical protein
MTTIATAKAVGLCVLGACLGLVDPAAAADPQPAAASAPAKAAAKTDWKVLCDGTSLKNWKITEFGGEGDVEADDGAIVMQQGSELTGIHWAGESLPKRNYEVALEAQRIDGSDFFCGLVFPVGDSFCSFVVGGWGGGVVGLSAVDGLYAVDNETVSYDSFDAKRWYKIRLRVSEKHIQAWIQPVAKPGEKPPKPGAFDEKRVVNLATTGRKLSLHPAVDLSKPFGVSCFSTVAAVKNIRLRELTKAEAEETPTE